MARRQDPLTAQVKSESQLRYGSSLSDLLSARRTNYHQYQNDVNNAHDVAKATKQAAKQAVPALKAIYNEADRARQDAVHQIALTLSGSGSGSALAAALTGESAATGQRMAAEKAMAQADAVQRGTDAQAGLAYAEKNALQNFRSTRSDLLAKTRDVHSQMGEFAVSRLADLQSAAADTQYKQQQDEQQQANSDRTYNLQVAKALNLNPITGKPLPNGGRTTAEQRQVNKDTATARDAISVAQTWIQRLRQGGNKPEAIVSLLKTGGSIPVPTGQTDSRGQPKLRQVPVPTIGSDFLRAAAELDGRGVLSQHSVHVLRSVHNVHIPDEWLPKGTPKQLNKTVRLGAQRIADAFHPLAVGK